MTKIARAMSTLLVAAAWCSGSAALAQPFAYVAGRRNTQPGNKGIQVLTVINTATGTKVAGIPLGLSCLCVDANSVVVSPDATRVYATNYWDNTVSVVDVASNSVLRTLTVNPYPMSLAVSPDGTRLYVSTVLYPNPGYVVQVVDADTGASLATIPLSVAQSGSGMAISPDGTRVYVSNTALNANSVSVINTVSNTVIATVPVGSVPRGMDITPDGSRVYVANQVSNTVSVINTATNTVVATVPVDSTPMSVQVTPNGARAFVAHDATMSVISTATNTVVATIPTFLARAVDFTPDPSRAFVATDGGISMIDTVTNTTAGSIPFAYASEGSPVAIVIPRAMPVPPDPPTGLKVSSVVGNLLTLRWNAPSTGFLPTSYLVTGGTSPGQTQGSVATNIASRAMTFSVPTGSYYIRLQSILGGSLSAASNEIHVLVNTATPPSAPSGLLGVVNGSSVALAWRNTFSGGVPSAVILDVSGAASASIPLGLTESFALNGVPGGTYTVAVRAINGSGSSPPSNWVTLTFPSGCSGVPNMPLDFVAYQVGRTIIAAWEPPASGSAPVSYVVYMTGSFTGSFPTTGRELSGTAGPGSYVLSVATVNSCGQSPASTAQTVTVP